MDRAALRSEYEVLHLIYYKNYRQHRSQRWWKYFRILHRRVKQLVKKFDLKLCSHLVKHIVPRAYRYFQSILAQGAFITLGFALIASLAKVWSILAPLVPKTLPNRPVAAETEDLGEVVDRGDIAPPAPKPATASKPKSKKKSKRKRDAIDDIFG